MYLYKNFNKRSSVNVHFTYVKITELVNKFLWCQCRSSWVMQICSATRGFADDRYLIKSCE